MSYEIRNLMARRFNHDFCWHCGNKGYWWEQIDGPNNQRQVRCDCPVGVLGTLSLSAPENKGGKG